MPRRLLVPALLGAAALVLAGCSSATPPASSQDDWANSPLGKIMAQVYGYSTDEKAMQARMDEQNAQTQELIAQCMSDEGFEYIPVESSGSYSMGDPWETESEEWVAQYGYGAVDYPGRDDVQAPSDVPPDPNQSYVESLSESEQQAYYAALNGAPPDESQLSDDGSYEYDWRTAGCWGAAQNEVQGEDPLQADANKPLMDAITRFYESSQNAPELADLDAAWASCMADAGEAGFTVQSDASQSIYDELNAYYEKQTEPVENDPALDEIGQREIELALVDLSCRTETDYRAKAREVQYALEEQFVAENKAALDALLADVNSKNR